MIPFVTGPARLETFFFDHHQRFELPELDHGRADGLLAELRAVPGVHEALVIAGEHMLYLKVDSAGFDEQNVLKLIAGEI